MLYREIIAVCSQIHTKHINTLCGQNVELLNVLALDFKRLIVVSGGGVWIGRGDTSAFRSPLPSYRLAYNANLGNQINKHKRPFSIKTAHIR